MNLIDLKVVIVSQCQLFSLPIIKEAVIYSQGEIVGIESELNPVRVNRNIKRNKANLLILTIGHQKSTCDLILTVKEAHPSIRIIIIALALQQVPMIIKTRMIKAILIANEDIIYLIQAIRKTALNKSYYSPETINAMVQEISMPKLTPREKEIADLLAASKSRDEIATRLEISYVTVNVHIRNINMKMDH